MKRRILLTLGLITFGFLALVSSTGAQQRTVGLFVNDAGSYAGYTLFAQNNSPTTYLIDNEGREVHSWATGPGLSSYLLEDGTLIRPLSTGPHPIFTAGGGQGRVAIFDWDGNIVWDYTYRTDTYLAHHDIAPLPNGNVLLMVWEYRSGDDAIAAGRDPALLRDNSIWPMRIIEVAPTGPTTGDIVWEWYTWDHLVQDFDNTKANYSIVADHPELVDINYFDPTRAATGEADWMHENGIDYNPELDQIVVSVRHFDELWIIDHSTTTAEAASHTGGSSGKGGDLLYRWGNPAAYDAGDVSNQQLFLQHDAQWVDAGLPGAGNLLVFNNGNGRPGPDYSSVMEITPPVDIDGNYALTPGDPYAPAAATWEYSAPNPTDFNAPIISGAQRLPNGNTLICEGTKGKLFEVEPDGTIVWVYINPVLAAGPVEQGAVIPPGGAAQPNSVFQAQRYGASYAGLSGQDLTPGLPIELYPDMDGDGLPNFDEIKIHGTDPLLVDTDSDGLTDYAEVVTYLTDPLVVDTDGGGAADNLDALEGDPLDPGDDDAVLAADSDGDGCTNGTELGTNQEHGGRRDPLNAWDFYDVDGNRTVALFTDIFTVAEAYGQSTGGPLYSTAKDRSRPLPGMDVWDMRAPDGTIDLFNDIFGVAMQFGHNCA